MTNEDNKTANSSQKKKYIRKEKLKMRSIQRRNIGVRNNSNEKK